MQRTYGERCLAYVMRPPQISERRRHARLFRARARARWIRTCSQVPDFPLSFSPLPVHLLYNESRNYTVNFAWRMTVRLFPCNYTWLLSFCFFFSSPRLLCHIFGYSTYSPDHISNPEGIKLLRRSWSAFLTRKVLNHYVASHESNSEQWYQAVMLHKGTTEHLRDII